MEYVMFVYVHMFGRGTYLVRSSILLGMFVCVSVCVLNK